MDLVELPEFCEGCARRLNKYECCGWSDPSGCGGQFWATLEQVEKAEEEIRLYIEAKNGSFLRA